MPGTSLFFIGSSGGGGGAVDSVNGQTGVVVLTTTNIAEGINLYYTESRVSANASVAANTAKVSADGSIDTHSDVDLTGIAVGRILAWDGSTFIPIDPVIAPVDSVNGQTGVVVLDTDDIAEGISNFYYSSTLFNADFTTKTTTDLAEGTNLYYTQARFDSAFALKTTTNLAEGTNLYYTQARFDSAFGAKTTDDLTEGATNLYYSSTLFDSDFSSKTTTDLAEGTNLYYTQARFDSAFALKTTTNLAEGTNLYYTQARFDSAFALKTTTNLAEGTNLYYTQARFDSAFGAKTTDDLTEGATNLYYSSTLFDSDFASKTTTDLAEGTNLYYTQARFDSAFAAKTTTDLAEGTNLYYTQARFDSAFAAKSTTDLSEGTNLYYTEARVSANVDVAANTAHRNGSVGGHSDVDLTGNAVNKYLQFNGTNFVPVDIFFGTQFQFAESLALSTTTSNTPIEKLKLTTTSLPTGNYIIFWSFDIGHNPKNKTANYRVQLNDTTDLSVGMFKLDGGGSTTPAINPGGHAILNLTGINTIDIDFYSEQGDLAQISRARLTLWRIS